MNATVSPIFAALTLFIGAALACGAGAPALGFGGGGVSVGGAGAALAATTGVGALTGTAVFTDGAGGAVAFALGEAGSVESADALGAPALDGGGGGPSGTVAESAAGAPPSSASAGRAKTHKSTRLSALARARFTDVAEVGSAPLHPGG